MTIVGHDSIGHDHIGHTYIGHTYIGHTYIGHNYIGHNYIGHDFIGHNYVGHNYTGFGGDIEQRPETGFSTCHLTNSYLILPVAITRCRRAMIVQAVSAHSIGHSYTSHDCIGHTMGRHRIQNVGLNGVIAYII